MNYYNEFDPAAAAWLRQLIADGQIPDGTVDERSIEDVRPDELVAYRQCHFFAGIGGWPLALRLAGWPDDRPIWTGSCPCQPFSAAGKGAGFDDERHLWPSFQWLIQQCRPPVVAGEQVASKAVDAWIDLVQADLEALGYAFGSVPFPAAGVGAPHIRDRNYWAADSKQQGSQGWLPRRADTERQGLNGHPGRSGADGGLADHPERGRGEERQDARGRGAGDSAEGVTAGRLPSGADGGLADTERSRHSQHQREPGAVGGPAGGGKSEEPQTRGPAQEARRNSEAGRLADTDSQRRDGIDALLRAEENGREREGEILQTPGHGEDGRPGPTNGHWGAADWLLCRDGKWRAVEPGTFPLVDGLPKGVGYSGDPGAPGYAEKTSEARVMRLKGYGNAIVPQQAALFIQSLETQA